MSATFLIISSLSHVVPILIPNKYSLLLIPIQLIQGMWWAVQTLTSLGYGDFSPQTILGKVLLSYIEESVF